MPDMSLGRALVLLLAAFGGAADTVRSLRELMQDPRNQALIARMGTGYEVVNPIQMAFGQGLSTRSTQHPALHTDNTTLLIDMRGRSLYLELQLKTELFPSTLVQYFYSDDGSPDVIQEMPENCYYRGIVRNHPKALAAFHTCDGIRGMILLENTTYLIYPLHGKHTEKHPHLLYHFATDQMLHCKNSDEVEYRLENILQYAAEINIMKWNKYIEIGLVIDHTLFEKFKLPAREVTASALEIVNYVDMLYSPLRTHVSLSYVETWLAERSRPETKVARLLDAFAAYANDSLNAESLDALFFLTGKTTKKTGLSMVDKICTSQALGVAKGLEAFEPHLTAHTVAHLLGHILGMNHDEKECDCPDDAKSIMSNDIPFLNFTGFSKSNIAEFSKTLSSGHGSCLFNMPSMRKSVCGNRLVEAPEECDCGPPEDCRRLQHCCDPKTCKFVKHAECSGGPCCRNCKLLSSDFLCRRSLGECDIPEFCNGTSPQCPEDLYKRNGAICQGGEGYCYQGACPLSRSQCQDIWGEGADVSGSVCFENINTRGVPSGHCGRNLVRCSHENSRCGLLHCTGGQTSPVSPPPHNFMVYTESAHDCKVLTYNASNWKNGMVEDGTKCGFQKLCLQQKCVSVRDVTSGVCPVGERQAICSGHGVCTHVGSCSCEEGWRGEDCSDEDTRDDPADAHGESELKLDPNLAFTVLTASIVTGLAAMLLVALVLCCKNLQKRKSKTKKEPYHDVVKVRSLENF